MKAGVALVVAVLLAVLAAAVALAAWAWTLVGGEGGGEISGHGLVALALGALGTLLLGGGLMFLVFYSARRGYDEGAEWPPRKGRDRG